jgi:hypothetical protein
MPIRGRPVRKRETPRSVRGASIGDKLFISLPGLSGPDLKGKSLSVSRIARRGALSTPRYGVAVDLSDRAAGCVLGLALGDALGAPF